MGKLPSTELITVLASTGECDFEHGYCTNNLTKAAARCAAIFETQKVSWV